MTCFDTSATLASLFAEWRYSPDHRRRETLVSGRPSTYEIRTRLHSCGLTGTHRDATHSKIGRGALLELPPNLLEWINDAILNEVDLHTLDSIPLASCIFLPKQGPEVTFAAFDLRTNAAAITVNIPLFEL